MTLRHLNIYVSVFQHNSITKASESLHLAQPSVSLAVRELEDHYGTRFFTRAGRRIIPTESGKEFYGYALHIVSLFAEMERKFRNWDSEGIFRIGASITIGTHILPALIHRCQLAFPQLRIEAVIQNSATIEQLILDNAIDIGLVENQPDHPDLQAVPFLQDALCAIVPPGHPLAGRGKVSLADLAKYPFFMREKGSAGRELLDASFALQQLAVRPAWESSSTQAIVNGVAQGLGVAVLPFLLVKRDVEEKTVVPADLDPPLRRSLHVICHRSKYRTASMETFFSLCREYGAECGNWAGPKTGLSPLSAPAVAERPVCSRTDFQKGDRDEQAKQSR